MKPRSTTGMSRPPSNSLRLPSGSRCQEAWTRIGPEHRARSCPRARRADLARIGVPAQGLGPTIIAWTTTGSPRSRRRFRPRSDRAAERRSVGRAGDQPPRRELPGGLPAHRSGAGAVRAGRGRRARGARFERRRRRARSNSSAAQPPAIVDTIVGAPWLVASRGARDRDHHVPVGQHSDLHTCPAAPKSAPENRPESLTSFRTTNHGSEHPRRSPCKCSRSAETCSAPERIRTSDLRFRRPTLYPAELRAQRRSD
jgi:hypothetical protein